MAGMGCCWLDPLTRTVPWDRGRETYSCAPDRWVAWHSRCVEGGCRELPLSWAPPPHCPGLGSQEAAWLKGSGFIMGGALSPADPPGIWGGGVPQVRIQAAEPASQVRCVPA